MRNTALLKILLLSIGLCCFFNYLVSAQEAKPLLNAEKVAIITKVSNVAAKPTDSHLFFQQKAIGLARDLEIKAYYYPEDGLKIEIVSNVPPKKWLGQGIVYALTIRDRPPKYGRIDLATFSYKDKRTIKKGNSEQGDLTRSWSFAENLKDDQQIPQKFKAIYEAVEEMYELILNCVINHQTKTNAELFQIFDLENFFQKHVKSNF